MRYTPENRELKVELSTKGCELSAGEIAKMEDGLGSLKQVVRDFPVAVLQITVVRHARSNDFHVKTSLQLSPGTCFTGERDRTVHPAYERCLRKLIKKVEAFKSRLQAEETRAKHSAGTHHTVDTTEPVDIAGLELAVQNDDFGAFRRAAAGYEGGLSERVGRWIERYPEIAAQLGETITISDIVEEIYLNAFDQFVQRPHNVPPGSWLEGLIDPSVQALLLSPDEEFAKISFARSVIDR